jgi:hypothetical protein
MHCKLFQELEKITDTFKVRIYGCASADVVGEDFQSLTCSSSSGKNGSPASQKLAFNKNR